jgi:hypothetical protein
MSFERATRRGLAAAVVLVAALAAAQAALAASPADRAAARQHWNQAEALKKKGQLAEACKHLEEVERLDPKLLTLMELAECSERLGKLVEARAQWSLARDRAKHDEKPQSKERAEKRLAVIDKRLAHLTLQLAANSPAGAQVLGDDVPLDAASLGSALPMNPGDHVIVVKAEGREDAKYPVKLAAGDKQTLAIAVGPAAASPTAPPASPPPPPAPTVAAPANVGASPPPAPPALQTSSSWWSGQRTAGVIFGAAGIVAVGAGSALCVMANRDGSAVDRRLALGAVSLASGGVLLLSGVVLLVSAPSEEAAQHGNITFTPTVLIARNSAVLGAAGEF